MSPRYTITEPHPTVPQNTYVHAGRGGAGNHFRAPLTTSPAGVPTPLHPVSSASTTSSTGSTSSVSGGRFYSGRGGAGNAHSHIERPVISFEDEYSRADKREDRMVTGYHVGRGGAGNFTSASSNKKKARQDSASSSDSVQSSSSIGSGVFKRLSGVFRH